VGIQDCFGKIKGPKDVVQIGLRQGGFSDSTDEIFNHVNIQIDNKKTTCEKDIEVCCEKTPPPPPCECSSLAGMECVKPDQCGVATQETSSFVIKQVLGFSSCQGPNQATCPIAGEICCKPKTTAQIPDKNSAPQSTPRPTLKCGIHHAEGLEFTAKNPSNGKANTHAGEWPHSCLLLDTSKNKQGDFVGGATLIAPGVIITAAHKVE